MARSRKQPYFTDRNPKAKALANKRVRLANKKAVKKPDDKIASGKAYKKESESWDIKDFSFRSPKDKKAYRK